MFKITDYKIAILTSKSSWFMPYSRDLAEILVRKSFQAEVFEDHHQVDESFQIVFILSYFKLIEEEFLNKHKHNLVVHESNLPKGRGWAPLFWQVIEGENKIPIVLFEAVAGVDSGDIYITDHILLEGHELHYEIREKQGLKTIQMCESFLTNYSDMAPVPQKGKETRYPKRTPKDSELDINKSIKEQFELLRTVNNENFPAFFCYRNHKYVIKIFKEE